jgi:acyl-CoA synthetase (AMP-forming)/AMP-acid ligase II
VRLRAADAERLERRVAAALAAQHVREGDRVAVIAPTSIETLVTVLGAVRAGIVAVPLNPALLPAEQDALLADAEPALVVRDPAALVAFEGEADLAPAPRARPMHYTSGTTGRPKGVWSGVLSDADAAALLAEETDLWEFSGDDTLLVCSPLHHSAPLRFSAATLLAGGDVIVLPRFDAALVAEVVERERPTAMFCVPTHLRRIFAAPEPPSFGSFRLLAHAGEACPAPLKERVIDAFPAGSVWEFYGATEGQFTACPAGEWAAHPGTVGRARPGRTLRTDDDGVIWCTVPRHGRFEYWRDPERTAAAWDGAAFTVGDVGRLDADGYLYLDGRRDDLVITGGVNVYPVEVEQAIAALEGVEAVAVFGVDDEQWGQRVCAAVVGSVAADTVTAHCRTSLAAYKCPKQVVIVDELPTTSTGKVMRAALAQSWGRG